MWKLLPKQLFKSDFFFYITYFCQQHRRLHSTLHLELGIAYEPFILIKAMAAAIGPLTERPLFARRDLSPRHR